MATSNLRVWRKVAFTAMACSIISTATLGDMMVTNAAGVRAGITGIVYRPAVNTIAVGYAVVDPTGTNITTFMIQSSQDLNTWTNFTQSIAVTGSASGEASDLASSPAKFYRMFLLNFQ